MPGARRAVYAQKESAREKGERSIVKSKGALCMAAYMERYDRGTEGARAGR